MAYLINGSTVISDAKHLLTANLTLYAASVMSVVTANTLPATTPEIGTTYGFSAGGQLDSTFQAANSRRTDSIDRWPFASDVNSTSVATLINKRSGGNAAQSEAIGFAAGSVFQAQPDLVIFPVSIEKFPFASVTSVAGHGTLQIPRSTNGDGNCSREHGYVTGGFLVGPLGGRTTIERYPFAYEGNITSLHGYVIHAGATTTNFSSLTHGYTSGAPIPLQAAGPIGKFPFASDSDTTFVGNLAQVRIASAGGCTTTNGYILGGAVNPPVTRVTTVDKVPFSTDQNSTSVGNIAFEGRSSLNGVSSPTHAYTAGGVLGPSFYNYINKWPFVSEGAGADVGDLTVGRGQSFCIAD